jgi:hypothetical protein
VPLPPLVDDVLQEATGRGLRRNDVAAGTGGPAGNALLVAWTGGVLLVLVVAQLLTLLDVGGLIDWHVGIGALLIPVALLKTGATGWRILRYYTGGQAYRVAGPPPLLLRVLGPLVVVSTLSLLASGVWLVAAGEENGRRLSFTALGRPVDLATLHQGLFWVFAVLTGLHVLARLVPAVVLTTGIARRGAGAVPGGRRRALAVAVTGVVSVGTVVLLLPLADGWHGDDDQRDGPPHAVVHAP